MRSVDPGGTDHNGADPAGSGAPSGGEIFPPGAEAPPLDHHLEEVLEALSELAAAEPDPGTEAYEQF